MSEHIGTLDSAEGSFEDNGFHLTLHTDEGSGTVRIPNAQTAEALLRALAPLDDWVNEYQTARADFDAGRHASFESVVDSFEGHGDFNSDDPMERYIAHQAAKGRL